MKAELPCWADPVDEIRVGERFSSLHSPTRISSSNFFLWIAANFFVLLTMGQPPVHGDSLVEYCLFALEHPLLYAGILGYSTSFSFF